MAPETGDQLNVGPAEIPVAPFEGDISVGDESKVGVQVTVGVLVPTPDVFVAVGVRVGVEVGVRVGV